MGHRHRTLFGRNWLNWPCPVRSALKRTHVQDFNSFSIMFYYIISTTCLKIGDLFCPIHIYGLSHSVHSKTIHHVNLALLDHHHDLLDYSHLRTYWIIELENDVCNKFACENAQIMVCSRVRPRMLTFLLRIYYAFIIKMLPFEVFRQKLGISFKRGIQQLRVPNSTQFWPPPPSNGQKRTF